MPRTCPKCGGQMDIMGGDRPIGFVIPTVVPSLGAFQMAMLTCEHCGYVELYLKEKFVA